MGLIQYMIDLHVHTMYSLLDSIIKPEELVEKIRLLNKPAIAITDHGNIHASIYMYKLLKKNNIKYIHGSELYICDDINVKDSNNRYYHLVVLAKNEQGRLNLNKLISISNIKGFYYKPRIDFKTLCDYKDGLIILSACMGGEVSRLLMQDKYDEAKQIALKYKNVFGDDYYLEYQSHSEATQQRLNRQIVDLAKDIDVDYVVTTDAHYLNKEDQKYHNVFVQIGQEREVGETYNDCYIQTKDDIHKICRSTTYEENSTAIANTYKIADKCNVYMPLSAPLIPHVDIPDEFQSEIEYLRHLCIQGWQRRRLSQLSKAEIDIYKERLKYEMNAIQKMGFEGYYLLVYSYANSVRRRGIARGSGGGSLVAYLLNIVDINPVKYGLYFERFIDVSAIEKLDNGEISLEDVKIPDFDSDFGRKDRDKVIDYIIKQYGRDRVADLGSFQYIWAKGAIKDIGKVLGLSFDITNAMTKNLNDETIKEALELGLLKEYETQYPELFEYAQRLSGLPKSFSMHPCGKVITMQNIDYYTAISVNNGNYVLQGDMHDAESLGLVKIDALGLRTVDVIYDTLDMIGKDYEYINPDKLNFNDPKVLREFAKGNTNGIFQFESYGMKDTLQKIKVSNLDDLGVANALYRPGSMQYIDLYADRKHGKISVQYLHHDLEKILKPTFGIIVFQEQLIEIGRLAGMKNPDQLRVATGKKIPELMQQVEPELKNGLLSKGWTQEQVDKLWEDMLEFAKYSFNKSHSYAYAIMAYICQYLKVYHTTEYMCALLNSYEGNNDKIPEVISEIQRLNINIKFDFKEIDGLCHVENGAIYYGTSLIKENNREIGYNLQQYSNRQYEYFVDLLRDIEEDYGLNKKIKSLVQLGYFSSFYRDGKCLALYNEFTNGKNRYKRTHADKTKMARLANLRQLEQSLENQDIGIKDKIGIELKFLGLITTIEPRASEDFYIVTQLKMYKNKYRPYVTLYQLKTGQHIRTKVVDSRYYATNQFQLYDVIKVQFRTQNKSKLVNGKWRRTKEKERVLREWQVF